MRFPRLACLALSIALVACGGHAARPSGCTTEEAAAVALGRLGALDWKAVDRGALAKAAPGVELFTSAPDTPGGIEAVAAAVERCCSACQVCGGVSLGEGAFPRVFGAEFNVCPGAQADTRTALHGLATAALPTAPPEARASRADDGRSELYSWRTHDARFSLRTREADTGDGVIGWLQLGQCRAEDVVDTWTLDDGTPLVVRRADVTTDEGIRSLWFEYLTVCLGGDSTCANREFDALWPRLRALAERERVTRITIEAALCTAETYAFWLEKAADGAWRGGFGSWRPKGTGP